MPVAAVLWLPYCCPQAPWVIRKKIVSVGTHSYLNFLFSTVVSMCLLQDFAVSGIRFGTLYTENQDVANAVASLCYFHGVCGPVQHKVAQLLRDRGELVANVGSSCRPVISVLQEIQSLYFPNALLFVCSAAVHYPEAASVSCGWQFNNRGTLSRVLHQRIWKSSSEEV